MNEIKYVLLSVNIFFSSIPPINIPVTNILAGPIMAPTESSVPVIISGRRIFAKNKVIAIIMVGLWIEYDNHEAKKYLKEVTRDTADLYLSPEVRKYHLAVELLLQDDYTSMEALAKEYYISKATVLNDLNELDELWEHYGVHFIKKVKYGIKVEGNESQIRSALLEALKRAGGRQKVTVSNIQRHFTSVELKSN